MIITQRIIITIFFLISFFNFTGQNTDKPHKVYYTNTLHHKKLTEKLTENLDSDSLKVKAIYHWITHHIKYDYRRYFKQNTKPYSPNKTLRKRKGVCTHYANLFHIMCQNAGIESSIIIGYGSNVPFYNGITPYKSSHRWNAVKLSNGWQLVDATKGAGSIYNTRITQRKLLYIVFRMNKFKMKYSVSKEKDESYCFIPADSLITTNLPLTSNFQFLTPPIKLETWVAGQDSIADYLKTKFLQISSTLPNKITTSHLNHYLLKLGTKALEYNPHNHYNVLRPATKITQSMYNHYTKKLQKKASYQTQLKYLDSISFYLKIIGSVDNKSKSEASKYQTKVAQYNKKRNKTLSKSALGKYGYYKSRKTDVKKHSKFHNDKAATTENSMYYLYKKNIRKTTDDILEVKKSGKVKYLMQEMLKFSVAKTKIDSINMIITQSEHTLNLYIDSIKIGEKLLIKQQQILNSLYERFAKTISIATALNASQKENKTVFTHNDTLHSIHSQLKAAHKVRDKIYTKNVKPYLSKTRTLVSRVSKQHSTIKKTIKRLKSSSSRDFNEDIFYQLQNDKYIHTLNYLEESVVELAKISKFNDLYYKQEFKICEIILHKLGRNITYEKGRFHYISDWHKKEKSNINKYYNQVSLYFHSITKDVNRRKVTLKNLLKEQSKVN